MTHLVCLLFTYLVCHLLLEQLREILQQVPPRLVKDLHLKQQISSFKLKINKHKLSIKQR